MIVYLGWGSLVWQPRALPMAGGWREDGPSVRVEFLRQSENGRLTLVLSPEAAPVPSYWTAFAGEGNILEAREALRDREGILLRNIERDIGVWRPGAANPNGVPELTGWAAGRGITAVLWTALPPKFDGRNGEVAQMDQVIAYLEGLIGEERQRAEEYIRRAPPQIATSYRRHIEQRLGWTPI
ncbi:hypothetical protein ACODUI_12675 [Stenotrophomonas geniculata]|uniref:hypothetical protein n=1 Tax=Stenotrophomonas geniculata TaxID=86188 RepID=UPI00122E9740|nr:hypothetical protein [Stenotrophomonas geniculata]MDP9617206.1 cation transport regulator ChaC [Stenotrophomonas maltophilia]